MGYKFKVQKINNFDFLIIWEIGPNLISGRLETLVEQ
jgi:hypothetical protein